MKNFRAHASTLLLATCVATLGLAQFVAAQQATTLTAPLTAKTVKGEKPIASPGWCILEEDFWMPMKDEPLTAMDRAQEHYQRHEEKAAANELKKVLSWLELAEAHATAEGSNELQIATSDLRALIDDMEKGRVTKARILDNAFDRINLAFAQHHYLKAKDAVTDEDGNRAAQHLVAAGLHLQHAAQSAEQERGDRVVASFDQITAMGKQIDSGMLIQPNQVTTNLETVRRELDSLAKRLEQQTQ